MMNKMMHALRIPSELVVRARISDEAFVRVSDLPKIIRMNDIEATLGLKRVIFNPPATIVLWDDGSKTVVKCGENEAFDREKGLAMAIAKRTNGNTGAYFEVFRKYCHEDEEIQEKAKG